MFDKFKDSLSSWGNVPITSDNHVLQNLKKQTKSFIWKNSVSLVFGCDPKHLTISQNFWTLTTWDKLQVPEIIECQRRADDNPRLAIGDKSRLMQTLDKIFKEMKETSRNTTIKPDKLQLINGLTIPRRVQYQTQRDMLRNILTNDGMADMGKNRTAEDTKTNTHHAIGTGTTAEAVTDHATYSGALETEEDRKAVGTRAVVNQTERYGTAFVDTDITPPKNITEAGLLTAASGAILVLRVTAASQTLDTGQIITVQTNVTHQNGTEV